MNICSIERIIITHFMIDAAIIIQEYLRMKNITNITATYINITTLAISTTSHKTLSNMSISLIPLDNPQVQITRESNKHL